MPIQFLTPPEISHWLKTVGQIEDPYSGHAEPPLVTAFKSPQTLRGFECFTDVFLREIIREGEVLVHITDFAPSIDARDFVFRSLWRANGENRSFDETPGCKFPPSDWDQAIAIFSLAASYGWKSYLYGAHDQTTLYNWEGEIFDAWTGNPDRAQALIPILKNFDLKRLEDREK